jgi:hypothetical protein
MKKNVFSAFVIMLGLLIALGPQLLFKVCSIHGGTFPLCHWSARAELGMGMLIAALGICLMVFTDPKTQLGLYIGIFFSSIIALSIPNALIGGCNVKTMDCRRVAFPAITIISVIALVFSAFMAVYIEIKKPPVEKVSSEMQEG